MIKTRTLTTEPEDFIFYSGISAKLYNIAIGIVLGRINANFDKWFLNKNFPPTWTKHTVPYTLFFRGSEKGNLG